MVDTTMEKAELARQRGDKAFARRSWRAAASHYLQCSGVLDSLWKETFEHLPEVLKLGQNLPQQLAYSLAQQGKFEEAVLALENGIARYLVRLGRVNDFGWRASADNGGIYRPPADDNVIAYINAAERLTKALASREHRATEDGMPFAVRLQRAINQRLSASDQRETAQIRDEIFSICATQEGQSQHHLALLLLSGSKPAKDLQHAGPVLRRIVRLYLRDREILQRYDFSDLEDTDDIPRTTLDPPSPVTRVVRLALQVL